METYDRPGFTWNNNVISGMTGSLEQGLKVLVVMVVVWCGGGVVLVVAAAVEAAVAVVLYCCVSSRECFCVACRCSCQGNAERSLDNT